MLQYKLDEWGFFVKNFKGQITLSIFIQLEANKTNIFYYSNPELKGYIKCTAFLDGHRNFGSNLLSLRHQSDCRLNFSDMMDLVMNSLTHKTSGYIFKRSGICHTNLQNAFQFSFHVIVNAQPPRSFFQCILTIHMERCMQP